MKHASRLASHCSTAAHTHQTLLDALIKKVVWMLKILKILIILM